jgi:hypothetical protein
MLLQQRTSRGFCFLVALLALATQAVPVGASQSASDASELERWFSPAVRTEAGEARAKFAVWQAAHPADPLGSAAEAASYLFEECFRQGVLTSEYFLDNKRFLGEIEIQSELRDAFFTADIRAQGLAHLRLETNPDDVNALFAMTLSLGMRQSDREGPTREPRHDPRGG